MLYYRNLNKLYTYAYLNKANEYSEMPEFSKESNIYSPKDVTNVFKILLKGNSYWSIINFLNFKALPEQAKETFEISSLQISIENLTKKTRMPSVDVCGGPCYQGPPKTYCSADPLTEVFSCKSTKTQDPPPICPMDQVIAVLESNNYDIIELNTEKNLLYNFRDNFLYNYSKGQAYIDDYYYIAEHFNNPSVQYSIAAQNLVKNKLIPIINKLMNLSDETSIIYDSATATEIINLVNITKASLTDQNAINKLDNLNSDILKYANKTLKFVRDDIQ